MGGDITGWSARPIGHYDERDLITIVTVPFQIQNKIKFD